METEIKRVGRIESLEVDEEFESIIEQIPHKDDVQLSTKVIGKTITGEDTKDFTKEREFKFNKDDGRLYFRIDDGLYYISGTRIDIDNNTVSLLSVTIVPLDANTDIVLYQVPTGKTLILSHGYLVAGSDAGTSDISIGRNGAETDFIGVTNLDNLDAQFDVVLLAPIPSATPATLKTYDTGVVIEARIANQAGGALNTLSLFGFLY